ncbi:MAG: hypothetical protein ACFC1C_01790 [Candidatus Malihini olakiniferum]
MIFGIYLPPNFRLILVMPDTSPRDYAVANDSGYALELRKNFVNSTTKSPG